MIVEKSSTYLCLYDIGWLYLTVLKLALPLSPVVLAVIEFD